MKKTIIALTAAFVLLLLPTKASANHSWGGYHWARTVNPFTVKLGDNLNTIWDQFLTTASSKWSESTVLDTSVVTGSTTAKKCRPTNGRVEVCNERYGNNGWLGVAQIWVNGLHIYQGIVKMNDTYFNKPSYNTTAWKNLVVCQEIGHTFGLDHQDENFSNSALGTCMDYTSDPTPNQYPNQHDYDELAVIYSHLDSVSTLGQVLPLSNKDLHEKSEWGKELKNNGKVALFERDFGHGQKVFTHVIWAEQ